MIDIKIRIEEHGQRTSFQVVQSNEKSTGHEWAHSAAVITMVTEYLKKIMSGSPEVSVIHGDSSASGAVKSEMIKCGFTPIP